MRCSLLLSLLFILFGCARPNTPKLVPVQPLIKPKSEPIGEISLTIVPKIDILFVIDNSGSMSAHQQQLSSNINRFIDNMTANSLLDYQIGITSTDIEGLSRGTVPEKVGMLMNDIRIVSKRTPDSLEVLRDNLVIGIDGGGTESVFQPLIASISKPLLFEENAGLLRKDPEAYFVVIFVTDAVDQSGFQAIDVVNYVSRVKKLDKFVAYGAIIPTGVEKCARDSSIDVSPWKMEELIDYTGGLYFSLCDADFGERLAEIGDHLTKKIEVFVPLHQEPLLDTIKVFYGQQEIPNDPETGWTYDPERVGLYFAKNIELNEDAGAGLVPTVTFMPASSLKQKSER